MTPLPRSIFPIVDWCAWCNHAGTGPQPTPAVEAIAARAFDAAADRDNHLARSAEVFDLGARVLSDRTPSARSGIVTFRFEGGIRRGDRVA